MTTTEFSYLKTLKIPMPESTGYDYMDNYCVHMTIYRLKLSTRCDCVTQNCVKSEDFCSYSFSLFSVKH